MRELLDPIANDESTRSGRVGRVPLGMQSTQRETSMFAGFDARCASTPALRGNEGGAESLRSDLHTGPSKISSFNESTPELSQLETGPTT